MDTKTKSDKIFIKDFQFAVKKGVNLDSVNIVVKVWVNNSTLSIKDDYTVRVRIDGKNSLGEDIQMVLNEHLHLLPDAIRCAELEGVLFNPVLFSNNKYKYECRIELLDDDREIEVINHSLSIL